MTKLEIIRAWKDEEYFNSLNESVRLSLPQNPAGFVQLTDEDLAGAAGAAIGSCYSCISCTLACDITLATVSPAVATTDQSNQLPYLR